MLERVQRRATRMISGFEGHLLFKIWKMNFSILKMFSPLPVPNPSLKRKENFLNDSAPFSKRSKFTRNLHKRNIENASEVEISNKEVDVTFWDVMESRDEGQISFSDSSQSFTESSKTEDSSNNLEIFSHVRDKTSYQVECFQLNIDESFDEIKRDSCNVQSIITENHYPCLEKAKRYFDSVDPIEAPAKIKLKYDPYLDDCLPNLISFTDVELSFLREIACGCRPMSWDEYEKCFLIEHGDKINSSFGDCLKNSVTECNNSSKKRKLIIEDLQLFYHNKENELFITEGIIDQPADDCLDLEDPLKVNSEKNPQPTQKPSAEFVLPISVDELSHLKQRMEKFELKDACRIEMTDITSENGTQVEDSAISDGVESASSDGEDNGSSSDIIVIHSPSKENTTTAECSSKEKKASSEFGIQTIDFVVDSIDEILENFGPSKANLLDVPSGSSKVSKSSVKNNKPSTSGARKRKQPINKLAATNVEKCSEFVTNMVQGLVLSDNDLHALKNLDLRRNQLEEREKFVEHQEKFIDELQQNLHCRQQQQLPLPEQQQQQQQQHSTLDDVLLIVIDNP